jgi:hypothetical protein
MKIPAFLVACGLLVCREAAYGLATEELGPKESCVEQPDWPKGIVQVARHPTRVYSIWVNGGESLYFQATPAEVNELVALFCKAQMRDHVIRIESGPGTAKSFGGNEYECNVHLSIVGGISRAMTQRNGSADTLEPTLTIHAGADQRLLKELKVPDNAIVLCEVEGATIKGKAIKPARTPWYGRVQLEGSNPAAGFEAGISIHVTLWDDSSPDGIQLASVNHQGSFETVFSDTEMDLLKQGKSWLTVTVGNYLTHARKEDPRFPVALLAREKDQAKALNISGPKYYWGRLLFEDGSPAILGSSPWSGAEIHPDFPYVGMARLDAEGYFKVFFTPEQFKELKSHKPRKNIYIPMEEQGRSTAMEIFPPELLSQDKAKAGVVKIAKPGFKPRYDPAKAPSLLGKALPPLQPLKLDLSSAAISNRMVLLCFFDLQERPSRYCLAQLAKSADDLKGKGVFIAAIQASGVGADVLDGFARTNHIVFPLGMIEQEEAKTKFAWGLRSQPWLILTDQDHVIRAEGFPVGELNDKLQALR